MSDIFFRRWAISSTKSSRATLPLAPQLALPRNCAVALCPFEGPVQTAPIAAAVEDCQLLEFAIPEVSAALPGIVWVIEWIHRGFLTASKDRNWRELS